MKSQTLRTPSQDKKYVQFELSGPALGQMEHLQEKLGLTAAAIAKMAFYELVAKLNKEEKG